MRAEARRPTDREPLPSAGRRSVLLAGSGIVAVPLLALLVPLAVDGGFTAQ